MLVWFIALAIMGSLNIIQHPIVLEAFNPMHAFGFLRKMAGSPSFRWALSCWR